MPGCETATCRATYFQEGAKGAPDVAHEDFLGVLDSVQRLEKHVGTDGQIGAT